MYSLRQSRRVRGSAGEALPAVFKALEDKGFTLRRGQLALIAGGPGTGKSAFMLTLALRSKVSTLYLSADSDAFVQVTRSLSIVGGWTLEQSARAVLADELGSAGFLDDLPIRLDYSASPSLDHIETVMACYAEIHGEYPALVVVDNLTNVQGPSAEDDPFAGLEALADYLSTMARETQACVVGLHHVTGSFNNSDRPIPLNGVKNQVTRVPALVATLHKRPGDDWNPDTLCVSVVKNRGGRSDPSGTDFAELLFDGSRMHIADFAGTELNL